MEMSKRLLLYCILNLVFVLGKTYAQGRREPKIVISPFVTQSFTDFRLIGKDKAPITEKLIKDPESFFIHIPKTNKVTDNTKIKVKLANDKLLKKCEKVFLDDTSFDIFQIIIDPAADVKNQLIIEISGKDDKGMDSKITLTLNLEKKEETEMVNDDKNNGEGNDDGGEGENPTTVTTAKGSSTEKGDCKDCGSMKVSCPDSTCVAMTPENNFGVSAKTFERNKVVYVYDFNKIPGNRKFYKMERVLIPKEERTVSDLEFDKKEANAKGKPIATQISAPPVFSGTAYNFTLPSFVDPQGQTLTYALKGVLPTGLSFNKSALAITGTATQTGSFELSLIAIDSEGLWISKDFTLTVNNASATNLSPVAPNLLTEVTDLRAMYGSTFKLTFPSFFDPEGLALTYALSGSPSGLTFDAGTLVLSGDPVQTGIFPLNLSATDPSGLSTSKRFILTVANPVDKNTPNSNGNPNEAILSLNAKVNSAYHVTFPFLIQILGQVQNYQLKGIPAGLTFDPVTLVLSGTPTLAGTYTLILSGLNFNGTSTEKKYILNVSNATTKNSKPVASEIPNLIAIKGSSYSFKLPSFIDAEGQTLIYSLKGQLPAGLTFNPSTLVISGMPTQKIEGKVSILALIATDPRGLSASKDFNVTVNDVDASKSTPIGADIRLHPAINSVAYTVSLPPFIDPEGQPLTYQLMGALPTGFTFNPSTLILGGTTTQTGNYRVILKATNPNGLQDSKDFQLQVNNNPVANLPPIVSNLTDLTIPTGSPFSLTLSSFTDPGGGALTYTLAGTLPTGFSFNTGTLVIGGTASETGIFPLTLLATNAKGLSASANFTLLIQGESKKANDLADLPNAMNELSKYNNAKQKEELHYIIQTKPVDMNTEELLGKNHVQFLITNVNRFFYDISIGNEVQTFDSNPPELFREFVIGGGILTNLLTTFKNEVGETAPGVNAASANGEPGMRKKKDLDNLIEKIESFMRRFNQLQADKLKAYNPCVYFNCCIIRDYASIANDLLEIKVELATMEVPYVEKADTQKKLKADLEKCDLKKTEYETFDKENGIDAIAKKSDAGDAVTAVETKKLGIYKDKVKAFKDCRETIQNAIDKLDEELKPYKAIVGLYNSLPKNDDIQKLVVFLERMAMQNQTYVLERPSLKGNRLDLKININSKDAITDLYEIPQDKNEIPSIQIPIIKRAFVSFSSGYFVSPGKRLQNVVYDWQPLPTNGVINQASTKYVLTESAYTPPAMGFAALGNVEYKLSNNFGIGGSMGVGLTIEKSPRLSYLVGGSIFIGELRQFTLTSGLAIMQVEKLKNNFQAVYDQQINYSYAAPIGSYTEKKAGWFISLSYTLFAQTAVVK
ncbi:putative Ig domain-containing protein [Dyadobacter sp. LJ53]|uniref:putative Ig domain-containing protein n=1 Tax=Dyadobacter chenwenxiniae TaxID=2906456 RepID=UPI001F3F209C|nr:putative Ig domain-containing protein [Dyadobacter chenwenxiniae]MCF0051649.1 putative Ig domain-containing protein [Dyadobacter chenwenxiniae]